MVAEVPGGSRGFLSFNFYNQPFFPLERPDSGIVDLENPYAGQISYPGFALASPLVVDVLSGTPTAIPSDLGSYVAPGALDGEPPTKEQVIKMAYNDFTPIGTGGVDFPSARPTSLLDLFNTGLGLVSGLVQNTTAELPQAPTLSVNATACPVTYTPGGKLVRQHLRKQQVKARKSPVRQCVTNRHMNSLNPKALRRATTRLKGFMSHVHSAQKAIRHALGHTVTAPRRKSTRGGCIQCGRSARSCVC